jgi:hypothetical protein
MKEKKELKEIVDRFDRGYTNTLYGNSFYVKLQKDTDFERLIELVKKLTLTDVVVPKETLPNNCKGCGRTIEEMGKMTSMCGVSACPNY